MLLSPIQVKNIIFLRISVIPNLDTAPSNTSEEFTFDGVANSESIGIKLLESGEESSVFAVKFRLQIENKTGKIAPYSIDLEVYGIFSINHKIAEEKREDMVMVNGCAILYSAIREQVMTLTSRCCNGPFILPTVNFLDKIKKEPEAESPLAPAKKAPRKQKSVASQPLKKK